ncbi:MAG TPA: cyclodeaminase/cyclohydrolase family protein [Streptosporangiaceae bacterium]|nr:cyclodeaminase/cyclohydrolase family protein [Streptosporangiaceae bacterium]
MSTPYLDLPVGRFLELLSDTRPDPGGGTVAALAVTLAASLCAMTASLSARQLPGPGLADAADPRPAGGAAPEPGPPGAATPEPATGRGAGWLARRATQLRDEAAPLAQADADGYRAVLAARRAGHEQAVQAALSAACDVPMRVAQIGTEVAGIAAAVAAGGNPAVRGDAITAALLAAAGAQSAALLVRINLAGAAGDGRPGRADQLAAGAARLAAEASRPASPPGPAQGLA